MPFSSKLPAFCTAAVALVASMALPIEDVSAAPTFETLVEFPKGPIRPRAGLVAHPNGFYYGTSEAGGASEFGTVFRVSPAGAITVLASFSDNGTSNRGRAPYATLVVHPDGNLYGTTLVGAGSNAGTVFRVTPEGAITTLVEFTGNGSSNKGANPLGALLVHTDGHLYGTTSWGGASNFGTVFRVTTSGVLTTLVEFTGNGLVNRGANPAGQLIIGADGNFIGTTQFGGANNLGTIFRLTKAGEMTTLVDFTGSVGNVRGSRPYAGLTLRSTDGNYYGVTAEGGASGFGTAFRLSPAGVFTTLADFTGMDGDYPGSFPSGALVEHPNGLLYGTCQLGTFTNSGNIFQITPNGLVFLSQTFTGTSGFAPGQRPYSALLLEADGGLIGMTSDGGISPGYGTVFRYKNFVFSSVHQFSGNTSQGAQPLGDLTFFGGNFYGATYAGGASNLGTIFRMSPSGGQTPLVELTGIGGAKPGSHPHSPVLHADGNFYGVNFSGGAGDVGTAYRLAPDGTYTVLVQFSSAANGGTYPTGRLLAHPDGNLYGVTGGGGAGNVGTIFRMTTSGVITTLIEFTNNGATNKGSRPYAGLTAHPDGNIYGSTQFGGAANKGTLFALSPAGVLTTLVEFTSAGPTNRGAVPQAALVVHRDGTLYGSTREGGATNKGTIFKVTTAGVLTTLVEYGVGNATGEGPFTPLTLIDGNYYGTTTYGGDGSSGGVFFRMSPQGDYTQLYTCHPGIFTEGYGIFTAPTLLADGNFYGCTQFGGTPNVGTFYRLRFGPKSQTLPADAILATRATLRGNVTPNGTNTNVVFEYGTDPNALTSSTSVQAIGSFNFAVAVSANLTGLLPGTTYYFRVRGDNADQFQPQRGEIMSFSTLAPGALASSNLLSLGFESGAGLHVRWKGIPGQPYNIEFADTLLGPWQVASGNLLASAQGELDYFDVTSPAPVRRFYRTVLAP